MSDLRDRIASVLLPDLEYASAYNPIEDPQVWAHRLADAVIRELDLGIPCAANGCKVRRIARYHAEKSSQLSSEADDE